MPTLVHAASLDPSKVTLPRNSREHWFSIVQCSLKDLAISKMSLGEILLLQDHSPCELYTQVQELSVRDDEGRKSVKELSTKLEASLKKLEEKTIDARKANEECKHLSKSLHELQEVNRKLSAQLAHCKKHEDSLEERVENVESINSKHKGMTDKYRVEIAALKLEIDRLQSSDKAKENELVKTKDLDGKLFSLEKRLSVLHEEKSILLDRWVPIVEPLGIHLRSYLVLFTVWYPGQKGDSHL